MREVSPPRHDLYDYQGEEQFPTNAKYYLEPRGVGIYGIVCLPQLRPSPKQVLQLKKIYNVFEEVPIQVAENGVITVEVPSGTKIGWILSRLAIFYRLSLVKVTTE